MAITMSPYFICGLNILFKPRMWNNDKSKSANIDWLYPITDQYDTIITTQNLKIFTANFYNLYQVYIGHIFYVLTINNKYKITNKRDDIQT